MIIKIILAGLNSNNDPDFAFFKVKTTEEYGKLIELDDYSDQFRDKLIEIAEKELNFDAKVIYLETDDAFEMIGVSCVWESASLFDLSHLRP